MTAEQLELEKKVIVNQYRKLLRHAKPFLKEGDSKFIRKAFNVALEAHNGVRRKSGEAYILHPIAVAQIAVEEIGLGTTAIAAALMHDLVEDTYWTVEDVEREFNPKVAQIIDGLTKISGVFEYGTSEQAENFRKMLLTLSEDVRVILIKLADRLHNMRTMDSMPRHKQLKIASETSYIYAPLAHRLGLYTIKSELEDLSFKYVDIESFNSINSKLKKTKDVRERFIRKFLVPIKKSIDDLDYTYEVKGRTKSIYSISRKMKKQQIPFEEVFDVFAIRIILDVPLEEEKMACWNIYSIVTDFYQPNPDRLRDWISTPKANGYESLHTTVMSPTGKWVEVQIRTKRMDDIAEKGYAAHWKYKDQSTNSEARLDAWISQVRNLLENNNSDALDFIDEFKQNLFNHEIFVFTPTGELKVLPRGAVALDFAFEIHSAVGASCIGAKINNKLMPITYELRNGDQVEILTSSKQKVNREWLRFVVTSKAKSKIKSALREEKKRVEEEGKEIVSRKFKQLKVNVSDDKTIKEILKYFSLRTINQLYYNVGAGLIQSKEIKGFRNSNLKPLTDKVSDAKSFENEVKKIRGVDTDMLLIGEDMDKIEYQLAGCCSPISGDDVFGFVTVNEGIKIHRTNCPNAKELMSSYGYRIVKAKWTSQQEIAFLAGLVITGMDRVGLVSDITMLISKDLKVNMRTITIDSNDGVFEGKIHLFVNDTNHLDILMDRMRNVNGVYRVERFD